MQEIQNMTGSYPGLWFDYMAVWNAVKPLIDKIDAGQRAGKDSFFDDIKNVLKKGNKEIRADILRQKNLNICGVSFWKNRYSFNISQKFNLAALATKESRLRLLHFKILHNIYPTNIHLKRMKIKATDLCEVCNTRDYVEHFFVKCKKLKGFWLNVQNEILKLTDARIELTDEIILTGICKTDRNLSEQAKNKANHIILIAKMSISKMRYRKDNYVRDVFRIFEEDMMIRGFIL